VTIERQGIKEVLNFSLMYQSQLTRITVGQLLDTGNCSLASYEESADLHKPILKAFLEHYQKTKPEAKVCPIT
jgi:hypothetical protein